jgi:hypothetical protein
MAYPHPSAPLPVPPRLPPSGRRIAAAIVQLVAGVLLAGGAALLWSAIELSAGTRGGQGARLSYAERSTLTTVTSTLIVVGLVQLALVVGIWVGWRPAVLASMVAAALLVLWDLFASLTLVAFPGKGGPSVLGMGVGAASLVVHAALFLVLLEALRQTTWAPNSAPDVVMTPAGPLVIPDAAAHGRAGWTQVAAAVLLLIAAGGAVFRFSRGLGSNHPYHTAVADELKLAVFVSAVMFIAAAAQLALAPRVGAGSRTAAVVSMSIAATLAAVNALVLLGLLLGDAITTRGIYHASGLKKLFITEPTFFLAANVLVCAFGLQALRQTSRRGLAPGFPLDFRPSTPGGRQ